MKTGSRLEVDWKQTGSRLEVDWKWIESRLEQTGGDWKKLEGDWYKSR